MHRFLWRLSQPFSGAGRRVNPVPSVSTKFASCTGSKYTRLLKSLGSRQPEYGPRLCPAQPSAALARESGRQSSRSVGCQPFALSQAVARHRVVACQMPVLTSSLHATGVACFFIIACIRGSGLYLRSSACMSWLHVLPYLCTSIPLDRSPRCLTTYVITLYMSLSYHHIYYLLSHSKTQLLSHSQTRYLQATGVLQTIRCHKSQPLSFQAL